MLHIESSSVSMFRILDLLGSGARRKPTKAEKMSEYLASQEPSIRINIKQRLLVYTCVVRRTDDE